MKILAFTKRNIKEIIRDPLSMIFCFIFPVGFFIIMQVIMNGIGVDLNYTPQFKVDNMFCSICVFSFSFLTMFVGMLIAKDRSSSFQVRLRISPLKPYEFFFGYALAVLPIALLQIVLTYITALCFKMAISWTIITAFISMIPTLILFIALGILIGTICNEKSVGGIASLIVNIAVLLGGMFFPLDLINGGFATVCYSLPFAPAIKITRAVIANNYSDLVLPIITILIYVVAITFISIFVFAKKMKSDKK